MFLWHGVHRKDMVRNIGGERHQRYGNKIAVYIVHTQETEREGCSCSHCVHTQETGMVVGMGWGYKPSKPTASHTSSRKALPSWRFYNLPKQHHKLGDQAYKYLSPWETLLLPIILRGIHISALPRNPPVLLAFSATTYWSVFTVFFAWAGIWAKLILKWTFLSHASLHHIWAGSFSGNHCIYASLTLSAKWSRCFCKSSGNVALSWG